MEIRPFPKPRPADPIEEAIWLEQADRAEVGREPFFCGRDQEYGVFQRAAKSLRDGRVGGGTMIFQGAPGAGKSALMQECMEAVRQHSTPQEPWAAVSLHPKTLKSPSQTVGLMVKAANAEIERLGTVAADPLSASLREIRSLGSRFLEELSQRGIHLAGFGMGGKPQSEVSQIYEPTAEWAFSEVSAMLKDFRLLIFIDEAQTVPAGELSTGVMHCLHHNPQGVSLVTAFFGLSDTGEVLRACGLSQRLAHGREVNLEPLAIEDATLSFRRMLDTYYSGADEEKNVWAIALADLSQGWPQHIKAIGSAAGRVIRANGGKLERHWLRQALAQGTAQKCACYDHRLSAGYSRKKLYIKLAEVAESHSNGWLNIDEIEALTASELARRGVLFDDFLHQSLHAGLLAPVAGTVDEYKFPIPSMGSYLRSFSNT